MYSLMQGRQLVALLPATLPEDTLAMWGRVHEGL